MTIKKYKNILITGASSGIGKQMAIDYAEPGVNLYLSGRNEKRLQETMSLCKAKGAEVFTKIIDVRDREAMKEWVLSCNKENNLDLVSYVDSYESIDNYLKEVIGIMYSNIKNGLNKSGVLPGKLKVKRKARDMPAFNSLILLIRTDPVF